MNQVTITGRLGGTPELKTMTNGNVVTSISVALYNGKDRPPVWVPVVAFQKVADFICQHFSKGDGIEVAGRLRENTYTKPDGSVVRSLEVEARDVGFALSRRAEGAGATNSAGTASQYPAREKYATGQNNAKQSYPVMLGTPSDAYAGFEDADGDALPF